jgi:hypothetical protein
MSEPKNERSKQLNQDSEFLKGVFMAHSENAKISKSKVKEQFKSQPNISSIEKNIKGIVENLKQYVSEVPAIFISLAGNEWFFPYWHAEMWDAHKAMEYVKQNNIEGLNNYMVKFIKKNLLSYRAFLKRNFNSREKIFDAIFNGLENKDFLLVIPVIYTQIDGIVFDFSSKQYFTNSERKKFLKQISNSGNNILRKGMEKIIEENEFNIPTRKTKSKINRHKILHGHITDYASELVAFKALSFLIFVSEVILDSKYKMKDY